MQLYELLITLRDLWLAKSQLESLQATEKITFLKIDQDEKRTYSEKQNAKKSLNTKKITLLQTIKQSETALTKITSIKKQSLIKQLIEPTQILPQGVSTNKNFNAVQEQIQPLIQLACLYEKRGDPAEYATKLASIFSSKQEVLQYLIYYMKQHNESHHPFNDACAFPLAACLTKASRWLTLAKQNHGKNLENHRFRILLKNAEIIEQQIKKDQPSKAKLLKSITEKQNLSITLNKINQEISRKKTFCDAFAAGHLPESQGEENEIQNTQYLLDLDQLYNKRAIAHLQKPFNQYSIQDLDDCYRRHLLTKPSKTIFSKAGIDDNSYQRFLALDRSKAGKNIPDILLDCENGYYIKKLNCQDEKEAAIAACLGKYTDCCQSISGENGEPCAIHGLTSEDSGFYVMFKGNSNHPNIDTDEIYGQTWVNRTASGMLVFDSLESAQAPKNLLTRSIVISAFRELANTLIKRDDVHRIQGGDESGISSYFVIADRYLTPEPPTNYTQNTDSDSQGFVADKRLFFTLVEDDVDFVINESACEAEIQRCLATHSITDTMRYNIRWVITNDLDIDKEFFFERFSDIPLIHHYIEAQKYYFDELNDYESYNAYPLKIHRDYDRELLSSYGKSALEIASKRGHLAIMENLLDSKAMVNAQNKDLETPLMIASENGHEKAVELLLSYRADPNMKDYSEKTALIKAVTNREPNTALVHHLIQAGADLNKKDDQGNTALIYTTNQSRLCEFSVLINAKANPCLKNLKGDSPLTIANCLGDSNIISQVITAMTDFKPHQLTTAPCGFWQTPAQSSPQQDNIEPTKASQP